MPNEKEGESMFNFKTFLRNFIDMLQKLNKKVLLSSLLVVMTVLFCFDLAGENEVLNLSQSTEELTIEDDIVPTVQSAENYIKQQDIKLRYQALEARTPTLAREEASKDLRSSGNFEGEAVEEVQETVGEAVEERVKGITASEYDTLLKIVEAEATDEDLKGKILVANVVLNRVKDDGFPNDIESVVYQRINGGAQFSPIDDGRFYSIPISDSTIKAVDMALEGVDYSEGALFFVAKSLTTYEAYAWFDNDLDFLFEHGVHSFYKYYPGQDI